MIDALIGGTLHAAAVQKTGQAGKPFVVCKVRTPMQGDGALFVNVICFDATTCAALLGLHAGEPVHLAGSMTPKVWTSPQGEPRPVLDLVCTAVLTTHHIAKKRKAAQETPATGRTPAGAGAGAGAADFEDLEGNGGDAGGIEEPALYRLRQTSEHRPAAGEQHHTGGGNHEARK